MLPSIFSFNAPPWFLSSILTTYVSPIFMFHIISHQHKKVSVHITLEKALKLCFINTHNPTAKCETFYLFLAKNIEKSHLFIIQMIFVLFKPPNLCVTFFKKEHHRGKSDILCKCIKPFGYICVCNSGGKLLFLIIMWVIDFQRLLLLLYPISSFL